MVTRTKTQLAIIEIVQVIETMEHISVMVMLSEDDTLKYRLVRKTVNFGAGPLESSMKINPG